MKHTYGAVVEYRFVAPFKNGLEDAEGDNKKDMKVKIRHTYE
jgi:hypothetical protein